MGITNQGPFSNMVYAVQQSGGAPTSTGNMCIQVEGTESYSDYIGAMSAARGMGMDTNKSKGGRYTCASKGFGTRGDWPVVFGGVRFTAFDSGVCQHSCNHVNKALVRVTD